MSPSSFPRIVTVGEATIDMILQSDGSYKPVPGGSSIIVAIALGRQGCNVSSLSPISTDGFGKLTRNHLESSGVDTSLMKTVDEPSTLAMATIDKRGDAQYRFYIDGCTQGTWTPDDVLFEPRPDDIISACGSFSLGVDTMADAFDVLFEKWSKDHIIIFDPNVRPAAIGDNSELALERLERWANSATIIRASTEDISWLYPEVTIDEVAQRFLSNGTHLVAITDGSAGAYAYTSSTSVYRPALVVDESERGDTVGAGDTFNAGMIKWLLDNDVLSSEKIGQLSIDELCSMLDAGIVLATQTCKQIGAQPPFIDVNTSFPVNR